MDGDLDGFINAYLKAGQQGRACKMSHAAKSRNTGASPCFLIHGRARPGCSGKGEQDAHTAKADRAVPAGKDGFLAGAGGACADAGADAAGGAVQCALCGRLPFRRAHPRGVAGHALACLCCAGRLREGGRAVRQLAGHLQRHVPDGRCSRPCSATAFMRWCRSSRWARWRRARAFSAFRCSQGCLAQAGGRRWCLRWCGLA